MGFKMRPKSPLTKKLVGGQHRLPAELKQEILNSPAKMIKNPTGPRAEKKTTLELAKLPSRPGKGKVGQEYLKGGQKGLTGKAAWEYGTSINPDPKEVTRLQKEYEKSKKKSPAKMKDLSGDGKITKKDVLIGRGVLKKDSPAKMKKPGKNMDPGFTRDSHGIKPTPLPSPSPKLPKPPKKKPTKRKILKRK